MKILVTGGCGFLGSHICEHYIKKGWEVIAYDNLTKFEYSRMPHFDIEKVRGYNLNLLKGLGVAVVVGDVRDLKTLIKTAKGCDYIIHTAAQPAMTIATEYPILDFEVNVRGTLNVLETAKRHDIPMANCSTIHIYGNGINECLVEKRDRYYLKSVISQEINEGDNILTGSLTPLHASKRAAEIYLQTYIDTYGLRATNFRLTGIYGPRQFGTEDHGWVALLTIKIISGSPIQIIGTGKQVRDILYVKDAVMAFDMWYQNRGKPGTYNIGGGFKTATSVLECIILISDITKLPYELQWGRERLGDLLYFVCDIEKATNRFGWTPQTEPREGIGNLINWVYENKQLFGGKT